MDFRLRTTAVAAATSIFTMTPALAETCDPAKFLKYEEIKYSKDIATQLFYLDTLSKAESDNIDTGGGFVYDGIPINGHSLAAHRLSPTYGARCIARVLLGALALHELC